MYELFQIKFSESVCVILLYLLCNLMEQEGNKHHFNLQPTDVTLTL